ncbi:MAG: methyltetrahydrofolate cobalamin methyltransferase [Anaerofustis sp.]
MIIIGEKINGSIPSVAKAIAERDGEKIKELAKAQTAAGATFIDVCASVSEDIEVETMKWLIDLVQEVTDLPIAVDSPSVNVCIECMKFCNKPGLFNSVSMEGDKTDLAFPVLAANPGWEVAALLNDDNGIPQTAERRLEVFANLMAKAKEYGIDPSRFHIDPLVEMLCTSEDGIKMVTDVIHAIKSEYPTIHITGAVSNISFNLPARKLVNQGFVVLAMNAGMDSAILDPLNRDMMGMIYATEALLGMDDYCMEYIAGYRNNIYGTQPKK